MPYLDLYTNLRVLLSLFFFFYHSAIHLHDIHVHIPCLNLYSNMRVRVFPFLITFFFFSVANYTYLYTIHYLFRF
ncbi:hypothetical protein C2G38_2061143, partial [Gigaspora rosea]